MTAPADAPDCAACDAICCRLPVILQAADDVPQRMVAYTDSGLQVMARDEEGWCVAVDPARMCCSIYETRPQVCRRFAMAGPHCRSLREEYAHRTARGIPLAMY